MMNCKFCNAELAEDMTVCPACGKEQEAAPETVAAEEIAAAEETVEEIVEETAEAAPAKANPKKITAAIIAIVLVAGILIGLVLGGLGTPAGTPATEPAAEAAPVVIPADGNPDSPLCKASYTVSNEEAVAARDVVVATMGNKELTNGQLQAFYWQEIYMFLQENSSYAQYLGMDFTKPLDQQLAMMEGAEMSWQQFLLDGAIATWKNYQALALEAEDTGYQLEAERQTELDAMAQEMEDGAILNGLSGADEMIGKNVGANCTLADYMAYVNTYYRGMSYFESYFKSLDPTAEEVEAFYTENEDYFVSGGLGKDEKFVNVRHVLLVPEGNEIGEDGYPVYTEEAWEACRVKAEELYNSWQEGDKSEESFAVLANENTDDNNDTNLDGQPDGGLYEGVYQGRMVPEFDAWCFDESRQIGDHGLVKTVYGYHIMFFCGSEKVWYTTAKNDLISERAYEMLETAMEKHTATVDFSTMVLGEVDFS